MTKLFLQRTIGQKSFCILIIVSLKDYVMNPIFLPQYLHVCRSHMFSYIIDYSNYDEAISLIRATVCKLCS